MRLDAKSGVRGMLVNLETGQIIRWVIWAELPDDPEQQGTYEAWRFHPDQCALRYRGGALREDLVYRGRCRMRFVPSAPLTRSKPTASRDLAGSLDEARGRVDKRLLILAEECSEPRCHRRATWSVSWEQIIEPRTDENGE